MGRGFIRPSTKCENISTAGEGKIQSKERGQYKKGKLEKEDRNEGKSCRSPV
jgi:hypothetical protein